MMLAARLVLAVLAALFIGGAVLLVRYARQLNDPSHPWRNGPEGR